MAFHYYNNRINLWASDRCGSNTLSNYIHAVTFKDASGWNDTAHTDIQQWVDLINNKEEECIPVIVIRHPYERLNSAIKLHEHFKDIPVSVFYSETAGPYLHYTTRRKAKERIFFFYIPTEELHLYCGENRYGPVMNVSNRELPEVLPNGYEPGQMEAELNLYNNIISNYPKMPVSLFHSLITSQSN
mgnify:CR=1 FL=1